MALVFNVIHLFDIIEDLLLLLYFLSMLDLFFGFCFRLRCYLLLG